MGAWIIPVIGRGDKQVLVRGSIVDGVAGQVAFDPVLDDDQGRILTYETNHRQFFGPDVQNLAEHFGRARRRPVQR